MENTHAPCILLSSPLMHGLGNEIQAHLRRCGLTVPHHLMEFTTFANGEVIPRIPHTIRGEHVFFLHGLQEPDPNTSLMMMFIANDAMKRASAASITLVTPYLPYLRQDRMDQPRAPISARLLADLIESNAKVSHIITIDMHAEQEQGFFSIPVDNLTGVNIFVPHLMERFENQLDQLVMLAPDFGGAVRNRRMALALGGLPVSIFEKRRTGPNQSEIVSIQGTPVAGKIVVIFEDMIDSAGTALHVVKEIRNMGAREIYLCATHGIFSSDALKKCEAAGITVSVTDSIPRSASFYHGQPWLTKVSIASYFAEAIYEATRSGGSISKLSRY